MSYTIIREKSNPEALRRLDAGQKPVWTHNIAEEPSAGYGELDELGFWEFQLAVEMEADRVRRESFAHGDDGLRV